MIVLECQATYPIRNSEIVQQEHVGLALAAHRDGRLEDSDLTTDELKPAWLFFPGIDALLYWPKHRGWVAALATGKLDRARSRLYPGKNLQENMRLKALAFKHFARCRLSYKMCSDIRDE